MEWLIGFIAGLIGFFSAFLPSFGDEVVYRLPAPSTILKPSVTVFFGGDVMLDRSLRIAMEKEGEDFIFSCLGDILTKPDLTVVNLEGPITQNPSKSVTSSIGDANNTRFTFATSTGVLLKRQGIDVVSLANNHAQDFGAEGVQSTMQYLNAAGVEYFGDPHGERAYQSRAGGVPLTFIGYNQFQAFENDRWYASTSTTEKVRAARSAGSHPIVFAHWGEEYVPAGAAAKQLAREWIDAGAELVIGAHPHVVQEHEEYAGKHIYYSLGNLVFDQYWEDAVRDGLLVEVTFDRDGVTGIKEYSTRLERDRRTCLKEY